MWAWSAVQMDQLSVAAYVRLQLQNVKDESRGTTQTCTARSNEISLRSSHARVANQIPLPQTTRREERQSRGVTFLRSGQRHFWKVPLAFWEIVRFLLNSTYHTINFCIFTTAGTISKSPSPDLHCRFYSTLDVKPLHIYSCWTLYLARKNTHL